MKPGRFSLAVIAAALLAVPAYSGAQQASSAEAPVAAKAPAAVAEAAADAVKAPAATVDAAKAPAATAAAGKAPAAAAEAATDPAVAAEASPAPVIEPEAAAALKRSSDFLQTLKTFSVRIDSSTDEVLEDGQKIQMGSVADVSVLKPNRLRVDVVADDRQRQFYYDGKSKYSVNP